MTGTIVALTYGMIFCTCPNNRAESGSIIRACIYVGDNALREKELVRRWTPQHIVHKPSKKDTRFLDRLGGKISSEFRSNLVVIFRTDAFKTNTMIEAIALSTG